MELELEKYKVENAPPTVYYIPNFITLQEEQDIIKHVNSVPKPKWTNLSNRSLQDYGGVPHEKGMIPDEIPNWLQKYMDKVPIVHLFEGKKPNQVLVNKYLPGQGIMPHSDGPLFYPTISTISCQSHTILEFCENDEKRDKVCELLLERRSLVIIKDDMYKVYLHSIAERDFDVITRSIVNLYNCAEEYKIDSVLKRDIRISLTIRNVPKVLKINLLNKLLKKYRVVLSNFI